MCYNRFLVTDIPTLELQQLTKEFKSVVHSCFQPFFPRHLDSVAYITENVLQHFRLYKFILTLEQPLDSTAIHLDFHQPLNPQPLCDGLPETEWKKKENIASLTTQQEIKEKLFSEACHATLKDGARQLEESYERELSKVKGHSGMTADELKKIVDSLLKAHLCSTHTAISQAVKRHSLMVEMKTEQLELLCPDQSV